MSEPIYIYAARRSLRLCYVLDWIFKERIGLDYILTTDREEVEGKPVVICYGQVCQQAICVYSSGLVYETTIQPHEIKTGEWNGTPTLYATSVNYTIPFDIFSAIFFLISRYEEYLEHAPDKHKRYPPTESLLYKNKWLERPLVDEWIEDLRKLIKNKFNIPVLRPAFSYRPTYDIDMAWSYKHKGFIRNAGGFLRDMAEGNIDLMFERLNVVLGIKRDPFDSFASLYAWHDAYDFEPLFFILAAMQTSNFDKNIYPFHPAMQKMIAELAEQGEMGIHPSYDSGDDYGRLEKEKTALEKISGNCITASRQHFIKMVLQHTYRNLLRLGITDDYSMGYGPLLGFRAGTGASFLWYDLEQEAVTSLRIHPFCFMEATAHYEMNLTPEEAFSRLDKMAETLKKANSTLITVFHNFSLGTDKEWNGWPKHYAAFLQKMAK